MDCRSSLIQDASPSVPELQGMQKGAIRLIISKNTHAVSGLSSQRAITILHSQTL
jgi:hypothetical protein